MAAPVRLQTQVWNPLGERRALLLHGLTSDANGWWRLASELADDGFLVVAPDLRGHGRSPAARAYDLASMAGDVALLGRSWDLVVGHSLGGAVAAHLLNDGEVSAAVLLDPVLRVARAQRSALRAALLDEAGGLDPQALREANPRWHETDIQRKALASAWCTPDVIDAVFADNDPWDVTALAASWRARVHLIAADPLEGGLLDPALLNALIRPPSPDQAPVSGEVVVGCGHGVHRDMPEVVSAAVAAVLEGT